MKERQKQHSLYERLLRGLHLQAHLDSYLKHCFDSEKNSRVIDELVCHPCHEIFLLPLKSIAALYSDQDAIKDYKKYTIIKRQNKKNKIP